MCMTWVSNSIQKNDLVYLVIDFLKSKNYIFFVTVKKSPLAQIFPRSNLDIPGQEL